MLPPNPWTREHVKVEGFVFSFFAVFLTMASVVYWFTSKDPTGTTALAISAGLGVLIGGYLLFVARRMEPRPQDVPDAEVADAAGELGHFSPGSYWPFAIAVATMLLLLGVIFGLWLSIIAVALLLGSVIGLLFEGYVGRFSPRDS